MPLCRKCNHPHGWYNGLCAACAAVEGGLEEPGEVAGVRPTEEEGLITLEIMPVPEAGSTGFTFPVEVREAEEKPPKAPRRRRSTK